MEPSVTLVPHANIGPRGCRRRGAMGWVWLALGIAIVVALTMRDAPTSWYAVAAIPFLLASLGYFQAREQTCVFFAAVGQRDMDGGAERITDAGELSRVRRRASGIWIRAIMVAIALTAVALLIATLAG